MLKNEEKKYLQKILYYLQHHNKNLTKKQDFLISDLVTLLEKSDILTDFENDYTYETNTQINYVGKIAEIINTEHEDLNDFIEDFCERHKLDSNSLFVLITDQEDENLWGEIIGSKEELPYHFEIKDVACFY